MVRKRRVVETRVLGAIAGALLLASAMVGCVGERNADGGGGERGPAATTDEEATAPDGERTAVGTVGEPAGLDVEAVSTGGNYAPVGFGEGSLWATEPSTCNDTGSASGSASSSGGASRSSTIVMESSAQATCGLPDKMLLKRLDPRTGEEEATITLDGFFANIMDVAVGAGSVWRVDPRTGEVAAKIEVGRDAVDVAVDTGSGDVWVAFGGGYEYKGLSRVDPETGRVVAEVPIAAHKRYGGAWTVAVGERAVWAQSADGGELFKVDPATNEVVARRDLGDYSSDLEVYGGAVWSVNQVTVGTRLYRMDPRTARVVASEHGPDPSEGGFGGVYGELVAGDGYVWFQSENRLSRVAP